MKKFFRLIFGRFFWIALVLILEFAGLIGAIVLVQRAILEVQQLLIAVTVVTEILTVATLIYILNTKVNSGYKLTWMVFVGVAPLIGIVFYLFFGNKQITKRISRKIKPIKEATKLIKTSESVEQELKTLPGGLVATGMSNYLQNESGPGLYKNTEVTYYPLGDDVYPVILEKLNEAKHYIFIEFFIIAEGKMWSSILEILERKVKEGVDVRLIYDDVGSIATVSSSLPKQLEKKGIKCFKFNPLKPFINVKLNNRDHRKILVIDGYIGFTGGINLADEYINQKLRFGHWKDNAVMLQGSGVYGLTMLFLSNWVTNKGGLEELSDPVYDPTRYLPLGFNFKSDGYVQPYATLPFVEEPIGERVYLNIASNASKYLYITTPYLVPDEELVTAISNASKKGVEVIILTPHIPDKKIVFGVTRTYYKDFLRAGVRIFEYTPGFVHAKTFICDDLFATVGTPNLDYRSLYLNLENGVYLYNNSCIKDMKADFLDAISKSEEITLEKYQNFSRWKRFWWVIFRTFAPLM